MSVDATRWAWTQKGVSSGQKLLLLALADRADEQNRCWPSISRLTSDTGLERKTILVSLKALEEKGLIAAHKDAGRANVYTLVGVNNREDTSAKNGTTKSGTSAKNGTSTKNGTYTSAKNGTTPVPKLAHESKRESKREPNKKSFRRVGENADSAAAAPLVYELPLHGKSENPKAFPVTKEIFDCWQEAYPLVDCRAELRKIKAWLVSNPAKRPASNMLRFVDSWMKRAQNEMANDEAKKARASPHGTRPAATTEHQRQRQNQEDLALAVLQMDREKKNGNGTDHRAGIGAAVNALPASTDPG